MSLEAARAVADAVLYEGYLLYPYRATSSKNQIRWQWGVLGPPGAAAAGVGEEPSLHAECLLRAPAGGRLTVHLRFLQLQARSVERADPDGFSPVPSWRVGPVDLLSWDEAVEHDVALGPFALAALSSGPAVTVEIPAGEDVEAVADPDGAVAARVVRRRWPLRAQVRLETTPVDGVGGALRLAVEVDNVPVAAWPPSDRNAATRVSFLGAHLVLQVTGADFVSLLEPPPELAGAAAAARNHRCWPVLVGAAGQTDTVLVSPIILYDYPAVAPESDGALFDSTEIDEILTLRVLTLTDEEKAAARATDPAAAAIIDRCEQLSPEAMQRLHGVLRDPYAPLGEVPTFTTPGVRPGPDGAGVPWWDPGVDASVSPGRDVVLVEGVAVGRGSRVRLHPKRHADAQDLFFADRVATVSAVYFDVDGQTHVAVVLDDDPAADLHEWYGRYLYFAPDEVHPLDRSTTTTEEMAP